MKSFFEKTSKAFNNYLIPLSLLVIGFLAVFVAGVISDHYNSFTGLLLIMSLATCLGGFFLGFLFGIPKLNKEYNPSTDYKSKHKYDPNTNLEEISDWLTKIIVGVSLTQLMKIPGMFVKIADFIIVESNCKYDCAFAKPIVISIILYFLIAGFLIGYFYTRIFLPKLFKINEENEILANENMILKGNEENIRLAFERQSTNKSNPPFSKVEILTNVEKKMLKEIKDANNLFTINKIFSYSEFSALNVLIEKRIIKIVYGDSLILGAQLSIIDDEVLKNI